ncbi:uncharacterized protein BcabD6B2_44280 [Babesia caballi]|uniref:Membrane protein, putative n=1 Tax=Babesia caballi TaxID=5871 RepID=A0AAV4LXU2_BABCB|nr:membrane protein, putative [Babesia caballi]
MLGAGLSSSARDPALRDIAQLRRSFQNVYALYAGMYLSQNLLIARAVPRILSDYYIDLKLALTLFSKIHLPLKKTGAVRVEVFHDVLPYMKARFTELQGYQDLWGRPAAPEGHLSLLSALHRANHDVLTDREIDLALMDLYGTPDMEALSVMCDRLMLRSEEMTRRKRGQKKFIQVFGAYQPTLGAFEFLRGLMIYTMVAKPEKEVIPKMFPSVASEIQTMLIASRNLLNEAQAKRQQVTDFSPEGKSMLELSSMLEGTDIFTQLYGPGYEERFARHPMTMMFSKNTECYEFRITYADDVYYHLNRGRSVYLFNYASACGSSGEANLSSMIHDAFFLANGLVKRFSLNFPDISRFRLSFHGTSLGGMFAVKTAKAMEDRYPNGLMAFVISQKTFGHLPSMAKFFLGVLGTAFSRFFGSSIDVFKDYTSIRMPKLTVFDVQDRVIPPNYSLAAHVGEQYFSSRMGRATAELQQLATLYRNADSPTPRDGEVDRVFASFFSLNSAGNHLGTQDMVVTDDWYKDRTYMNMFVGRMLAFGSLPAVTETIRYGWRAAIPDLLQLMSHCHFEGFGVYQVRSQYYLKVPRNVAVLFNMMLEGRKALTAGATLNSRIVVAYGPPEHQDLSTALGEHGASTGGSDELCYYVRWPSTPGSYRRLDRSEPLSEHALYRLRRDLQYFDMVPMPLDGVNVYAWMQLYMLVHVVDLVRTIRERNDAVPGALPHAEAFAKEIVRLAYGVDEPVLSEETGSSPRVPPRDIDSSFSRDRFRIFGNILTTYVDHSDLFNPEDEQMATYILEH